MLEKLSPVPWRILSFIMERNMKRENTMTISEYPVDRPKSSASSENRFRKGFTTVRPRTANTAQVIEAMEMPFPATFVALSSSLSPSFLERKDAMPTPVPTPKAIRRFCRGNARDTAVSAVSERRATNIESTMLYRAWTSILIIKGSDILKRRGAMPSLPMMFSFVAFSLAIVH